jgi:phosphopantothenoylcysteine decarboxylase
MPRIILGVTGSVAAVRTPALFAALENAGHEVRVVATEPALYFFDSAALGPPRPGAGPLFRDADEWPGQLFKRGDPVLHIELRQWADFLVVAPLDANTLAKFALGLADNLLTCLFRAWNFARPVILAPAMNTLMWQSPVTLRHLRLLLDQFGQEPARCVVTRRGSGGIRPLRSSPRPCTSRVQAARLRRHRRRCDGRSGHDRRSRPELDGRNRVSAAKVAGRSTADV